MNLKQTKSKERGPLIDASPCGNPNVSNLGFSPQCAIHENRFHFHKLVEPA
jgi:hypothetical protein